MVAHINIEASRRKRLGASCCVQGVFDGFSKGTEIKIY